MKILMKLLFMTSYTDIAIREWINNYTNMKWWNVISSPCDTVKGSLVQSRSNKGIAE